jgi:hypothetical protein
MMHRPLPLTGFIFATASLSLLHVSSAFAQPTPEPTKQEAAKQESPKPAPVKTESQIKAGELFSEGRKLVEAGDYKQACPKFEQSLAVNFGIGAQFNLADCWEHIGRTASAQQLFQGVAASARAAGQADRAQVAQARADALEPRLVRLLIDVKAADPELVVRRNHIVVEKKAWGAATPSDAGDYLVEAIAPGKKPWSTTVAVPASASQIISITVPLLEPSEAAKPVEVKPTMTAPVEKSDAKRKRRNTYAYVIGGLGVASVGIGTFFAVKYKSKNSDAKELCPDSVSCSQSDIDRHAELVSDAKTFRTGAFIGFGVGAAALITSAALFLAPSSSSNGASLRAAPFVTADGSWGAVAAGRF